jgi:RNA polymerase sigma factor (sigma-70 family)
MKQPILTLGQGKGDPWRTRKTLLLKAVQKDDHDAWEDFVGFYGKFIFHIILKMGVPHHESDDVSQQILIKLWKRLETYSFEKGPFRPWLATVIRNCVYTHFGKGVKVKTEPLENLNLSIPAEVDSMIQMEWEDYLTDLAMVKVRSTFSEKSVQAFMLSIEGHEHAEIAETLNIAEKSVKVLKSRVKKCFVLEMKKLLEQKEGA